MKNLSGTKLNRKLDVRVYRKIITAAETMSTNDRQGGLLVWVAGAKEPVAGFHP